jgi:O-acetylserine/cysteine efflux transporter
VTPAHWALIVVINLVFGLNLVLSKLALEYVGPFTFLSIRFAMVAVVMAAFLRVERTQMLKILVIALSLGAVHFALSYIGLSKAGDAATMGVAVQLLVPLATLLSIIFLGERIGWRRSAGMLVAFAGVFIMSFDPRVFAYIEAFFWVFGGAVAAAIGTVLMKTLRNVGAFQLQAWTAWVTTPCLVAAAWLFEDPGLADVPTMPAWIWAVLIFSGVGTSVIGHGGFYYLLQRYDVSHVAPLTLAAPVITAVFGVLILDDVITVQVALGGAATLAGVLVLVVRGREGLAPETESAVLASAGTHSSGAYRPRD